MKFDRQNSHDIDIKSIRDDTIEFMPSAIEDEIKRGMLMTHTYHVSHHEYSYRVYSEDEQRILPSAGREYLWQLEQGGYISTLQREWIIDSVLANTDIAKLAEAPMSLLVATAFIVLLLDNISHGKFSVTLSKMQEVSLRVH